MKGQIIGDAVLLMADSDNVATALMDLEAGQTFVMADRTVRLKEDIAFGHKFALQAVDECETIRKYGEVIGEATTPIVTGEWVHTHNVDSTRGRPEGNVAGRESSTPRGDE